MPIGLVIAGELLFLRIPLEGASDPAGDVAQVAQRGHAMAILDVHDRVFARAHAVEEVLHVVVAFDEANRIGGQRVFVEALWFALVTPAIDRDLARPWLCADKLV